MQFTKLFNSILDSTIWQEPATTKILWITLLAMCDRRGDVFASIPGLAKRAGITVEECETAINCFLSPDKYSRTKDFDGRRIEEIDGGWTLLNHGKYRELLSAEERREYNRRKQQEHREKNRNRVNQCQKTVKHCQQMSAMSAHTEAEADTDTELEYLKGGQAAMSPGIEPRKERKPAMQKPSVDEMASYAVEIGLEANDGEAAFHRLTANGWKTGGNAVKDWRAYMRAWKSEGYHPSQKAVNGQNGFPKRLGKLEQMRADECQETPRKLKIL